MSISWSRCVLFASLAVAVESGCGGGVDQLHVARVSGKVSCNGKPVTAGMVIFMPRVEPGEDSMKSGKSASGLIQPDGTYVLSTYGSNDGAIVATHSVQVFAPPLEDDDIPLTVENQFACGNAPLEKVVYDTDNSIDLELEFTPAKKK